MPRNALRICLLLSSSGKSEYKRILARNSPSHPSRSDSLLDSHLLMPKMAETFSWQFVSNITGDSCPPGAVGGRAGSREAGARRPSPHVFHESLDRSRCDLRVAAQRVLPA